MCQTTSLPSEEFAKIYHFKVEITVLKSLINFRLFKIYTCYCRIHLLFYAYLYNSLKIVMPLKWKAQHLMYSSLVFFKSRKFIECLIFHPSHEYIHGFCIWICLHCTLMQSFFLMSSWKELTYKLVYLLWFGLNVLKTDSWFLFSVFWLLYQSVL